MENENKPYTFAELVEGVCTRTRMYTLKSTFVEVATFLDGFDAGCQYCDPNASKDWTDFTRRWLPMRLKYPPNYHWSGIFQRMYPNDAEAIEQLHLLFEEYKAIQKPK